MGLINCVPSWAYVPFLLWIFTHPEFQAHISQLFLQCLPSSFSLLNWFLFLLWAFCLPVLCNYFLWNVLDSFSTFVSLLTITFIFHENLCCLSLFLYMLYFLYNPKSLFQNSFRLCELENSQEQWCETTRIHMFMLVFKVRICLNVLG